MTSKDLLWTLMPHTVVKHVVLRRYLDAWIPIMMRTNGRVFFIDAFAGPGEYEGGEPGSPVIALNSYLNHSARSNLGSEIGYLFIEKREDRAQHLDTLLAREFADLPSRCKYWVRCSSFDETMAGLLDRLQGSSALMPPSFVMIDPFGVSGTPMSLIGRILANSKSEVYVSFMYEWLNRFLESKEFEPHLDQLFGCAEWREFIEEADPTARKLGLFGLYKRQLKGAGASEVLHFELWDESRIKYAIFFGTQDLTGCDKMKQAIWKVDPMGTFKIKGGRINQLTLGGDTVNFALLGSALTQEFGTSRWVGIDEIERYVKSDAVEFHSGQLRRNTLAKMEKDGHIDVHRQPGKRAGSFAKGTFVRFGSGS